MCGIAGLVGQRYSSDRVREMAAVMTHRGPDGSGTWKSQTYSVSLGHQRLAIVDLSETGEQPMALSDAGLALVYNGELYNLTELRGTLEGQGVRFRGHSDTEVLLHAYERWGIDCLSRVSGMFAFGIVDEDRGELVLARDRCGQKPLYYVDKPNGFAFASEVKAFHELDEDFTRIDPGGLEEYLAYGYTLGPQTLTAHVRKLRPGEVLRVDLRTTEVRLDRYWALPRAGGDVVEDVAWLKQRFEELLEDSVRRHLVADVPVGVLLSGGIDSSLVAAMASRLRPNVRTFTVSFPGQGRFDESSYARKVVEKFGLDHTELEVEGFEPEMLRTLAEQYDDPVADQAIVSNYLLSKRVKREVAVALGGDGGDELFGGYRHYLWIETQARLRLVPGPVRQWISSAAEALPVGARGRHHLMGLAGDVESAVAHVNLYFDAGWRSRLVNSLGDLKPETHKCELARGQRDPLDKIMATDFYTTLAEGYLMKVDRSSMLSSLEVRAPMLDDSIIRFSRERVPSRFKCHGGETKILLRQLAADILPEGIASKPKQGFTMPLNEWMSAGWGEFLREILFDPGQQLFEHEAVERLFTLQTRGLNNSNRILSLAILALWRDVYGMGLP